MPNKMISVDPDNDVGMSIGSTKDGSSFLAVDGFHDFGLHALTGNRRFFVTLSDEEILWMIQSLAKELPSDLHEHAQDLIGELQYQ